MIKREDVYKIGVFNKPHGIHGELSFTFTDDIFENERKTIGHRQPYTCLVIEAINA